MASNPSQNLPPAATAAGILHHGRLSTPPPQSTDFHLPSIQSAPPSGLGFVGPPPSPPRAPPPPLPLSAIDTRSHGYYRPSETKVLEAASAAGRLDEVHQILAQYLIEHGPDPETGKLDLGMFCASIYHAIINNHPAIVSYLFYWRIGTPSTYLPSALQVRSTTIFQIFLDYGWDINQPYDRISPPSLGHICDDRQLVKWFLEKGADVNAGCEWDWTCMSDAMTMAPLDTIRLFFDHGGDINRGQLLHHAARREGPESDVLELMELLLSKGAPINGIQYANHPVSYSQLFPFSLGTPLHYAVAEGRLNVVAYLLEKGADPSIKDTKGRTAAEVAKFRGKDEVLPLLLELESNLQHT